jgi:CBS-domain-containing membrane protein
MPAIWSIPRALRFPIPTIAGQEKPPCLPIPSVRGIEVLALKILDAKFAQHKARYVFQSLLAVAAVLCLLVILDAIQEATIIASFGASSFIVFTMPKTQSARPRPLIGGYVVGTAMGCFSHSLMMHTPAGSWLAVPGCEYAFFGALAAGLAIFTMVITNTEHPPAAGLALAFVLNPWNHWTVAVVMAGVVILSAIRYALRSVLINLL